MKITMQDRHLCWSPYFFLDPAMAPPLLSFSNRHCQDRIISLLQVMHTAKYAKVKPSYKAIILTYTSKQKL